MNIEQLIKTIEAEQKKVAKEAHSSEGLVRLQEVMTNYTGEDELIWSDDLLKEISSRPQVSLHKTKVPLLDDLIGGFREQQLVTVSAHSGHGKCLAKGTGVLMYDGSVKKVEDIKVGDEVMGPDSKPKNVLALGRGEEEMYQISQRGAEYVVNKSHILSLKTSGSWDSKAKKKRSVGRILNISVDEYLEKSAWFKTNYKGWMTGVDFIEKPVTIEPYYLGVWLGDGKSSSSSITNVEPEIEEYLEGYANRLGLVYKKYVGEGKAPTLSITSGSRGRSYGGYNLIVELRRLGVLGDKHIPQSYKTNTRKVRMDVLAGIIDTDGYLYQKNGTCYDIILKSKRLADDVVFIARSLGLGAVISECTKTIKSTGFSGQYHRIRLSGDIRNIPVRVKRKKTDFVPCTDVLSNRIKVKPLGVGEYYGFELGGDGLFLLDNFVVTHNTAFTMFLTEQFQELNPVVIPLEQSNEEIVQQRYENGYSIPRFLSPRNLSSSVTVDWIERKIIEGISKYNTKFVVIDHLGYIDDYGENARLKKENLAYRIEAVMKGLKSIAKRWNVIIVIAVHIAQLEESKPPTLKDLKNSSAIKQESDMVLMLWRKNRTYKKIHHYENETLVSVMKNRRTGRNGNVGLRFVTETGRYVEDNSWVADMEKLAAQEDQADKDFNAF